jgi:hypothetical protein
MRKIFLSSFYEATIIVRLKPNKDITEKENYSPMSHVNRDEK